MVILWTKAIIVLQLKHQVINSFFTSRTLNLMPRFKWEKSVFVCQLHWRVRIAVVILCSSWHMGHPPKAMKYITCGVIPFRPWHAFCDPLVRLSATAVASLSSVPFPLRLHRFSSSSPLPDCHSSSLLALVYIAISFHHSHSFLV